MKIDNKYHQKIGHGKKYVLLESDMQRAYTEDQEITIINKLITRYTQ